MRNFWNIWRTFAESLGGLVSKAVLLRNSKAVNSGYAVSLRVGQSYSVLFYASVARTFEEC